MSTSVDVLAVMQELDDELQAAATYSGEGCYWFPHDDVDLLQRSAAARAAIADLIEASSQVYDALAGNEDWWGLWSALARVKGA